MFEKYVDLIDKNGISPEIINQIIAAHEPKRRQMIANFERYKAEQDGDGVPIYSREFEIESANKVNNKLANDFFSEIVDTKTGYLFGAPVVYALDKTIAQYEELSKRIERFRKVNNLDDLNGECGKFAAICGYDGLLMHHDNDAQERISRIDPWEVVILSRGEITEPTYGLRYYTTYDNSIRAEFYDNTNRHVYEGKDYGSLSFIENEPHNFDYCPLWGFPNNAELQGDVDKVLSLIDAYDKAASDMSSEIEQFRLAYMIFVGYAPDEKVIEEMKKTGAIWIPDAENGETIKFLVKDLKHEPIIAFMDKLESNITRFAKHVNFTDAFGGGDITGPAMKYKLSMLEWKSKIMERKHEAAMLYMFKVLATVWEKRGFSLDYTMLDMKYTRSVPVNLLDEAQTAVALMAVASRRTALGTLSVVPDVDEEMAQIEEEAEALVDLDAAGGDEGGQAGEV
jgi:SPP1 family phage portal protein